MDKRVKIETLDEARALMKFLCKEKKRHQRDINQIDLDILALIEKWQIEEEEIPWNAWFEV